MLDLAIDKDGSVLVLDSGNSRITVVSETGKYIRAITIKKPLERLVTTANGLILASPPNGERLMRVSSTGDVVEYASYQTEVPEAKSVNADKYLLLNRSQQVIVVYRWATRFLKVTTGGKGPGIVSGNLLDPQPFPEMVRYKMDQYMVERVDPKAQSVVGYAATVGDTLFVVDRRRKGSAARFDAYDTGRMQYVFSRPMLESLRAFGFSGNLLFGVVEEPLPALVAWRWVADGK